MGNDGEMAKASAVKGEVALQSERVTKHILNAQVSIRAPCCQKFYDCPECHAETQTHGLAKTIEMVFICKKCKRAFRKDLTVFEESDEYCPHCDNHFVVDAKTPAPVIGIEGEDARMDNRMLKDERLRYDPRKDFYGQSAMEERASERIDEGGVQEALRRRMQGEEHAPDAGLSSALELARQAQIGGSEDEELDWS